MKKMELIINAKKSDKADKSMLYILKIFRKVNLHLNKWLKVTLGSFCTTRGASDVFDWGVNKRW